MASIAEAEVLADAEGGGDRAFVAGLRFDEIVSEILSLSQGHIHFTDGVNFACGEQMCLLVALTGATAEWEAPVVKHLAHSRCVVSMIDPRRSNSCAMNFFIDFVYGLRERCLISEADPIFQLNIHHAFFECDVQEVTRTFASVYGMTVDIVCAFRIYGPDHDARCAISLIANPIADAVVKHVVANDLSCKRDGIHVYDVSNALRLYADQPFRGMHNVRSRDRAIQTTFVATGRMKLVSNTDQQQPNDVMDIITGISALRKVAWLLGGNLGQEIASTFYATPAWRACNSRIEIT